MSSATSTQLGTGSRLNSRLYGDSNCRAPRQRATRSATNVGRSSGTRKVASMPTCIGVRDDSANSHDESLILSSLRAMHPPVVEPVAEPSGVGHVVGRTTARWRWAARVA